MGETTKRDVLHNGCERHGYVGCTECTADELRALRARLSAAERERDAFRDRLLGRANEEPPSGWLRPGEGGYENTPEGARQARDAAIRDRDAAFARGVEAAAARIESRATSEAVCADRWKARGGPMSHEAMVCRHAAGVLRQEATAIRALAPAPDARKETTT